MDTKEFIASIVGSLAWPAVAGVVVIVLRAELRTLMRRPISRLAVGPIEGEWHPIAEQTRSAVEEMTQEDRQIEEAVGSNPSALDLPPDGFTGHLQTVADSEPAAAIQAANGLVGQELLQRLMNAGQPQLPTAKFSTRQLAVLARNYNLISPATLNAINGLDVLSSLSSRGGGTRVTPIEAHEFLDLVEAVLFTMATPTPEPS